MGLKKKKNSNKNIAELTTTEYEEMFLNNFKRKNKHKTQFNNESNIESSNQTNVLVKPKSIKPKSEKQKSIKKRIEYIRHCPKCDYFIRTKNKDEYFCPRCNAPMHFALNCDRCNLWFDVKTSQKYLCPKCSQLLPK